MHSMLVLFQANTLNVAFNSHNKSLLTIMMSNNVRIIIMVYLLIYLLIFQLSCCFRMISVCHWML